jgi:hypothetical protein
MVIIFSLLFVLFITNIPSVYSIFWVKKLASYINPHHNFIDFKLWLKRRHRIKDTTIKAKIKRIKHLNKFVNLWDIEAVTDYIQDADWSNGYKELMEY